MAEQNWVTPYEWCDKEAPLKAETVFAHPGDYLNRWDQGRHKDVCVVGGGIAGLTAAFELAIREHRVTLLERSNRWGGRIYTRRFNDGTGTYGELGAMRRPDGHECV